MTCRVTMDLQIAACARLEPNAGMAGINGVNVTQFSSETLRACPKKVNSPVTNFNLSVAPLSCIEYKTPLVVWHPFFANY